MKKYKLAIAITGASSGLGSALAIGYADKDVILYLIGRNKDNLDKVAVKCRTKGAKVKMKIVDVTDSSKVASWIEDCFKEQPIDILYANAGVSAGTLGVNMESNKQTDLIWDTNVKGVYNSVLPAANLMLKEGRGHIVIIGSIAGIVALPSCPSYSASKAAVKIWGDAMRRLLYPRVKVSIVLPGYIETPMTAVNNFPMPWKVTAKKAATKIIKGVNKNKAVISFPWQMVLMLRFLSLLPNFIIDRVTRNLPGKEPLKL